MSYSLNGNQGIVINNLDLMSIERRREEKQRFKTDSTIFSERDEDLFQETEWKGIIEEIPNGP